MFLQRLIALAGSWPLVHPLLERTARADAIRPAAAVEAPGVEATPVKYPGLGATLEGYLAKPSRGGPFSAVIFFDEDGGLNDWSRDQARQLAASGFAALAVDPLSRRGGTLSFASPEAARQALATLNDDQLAADLNAAFAYLQSHPSVRQNRISLRRSAASEGSAAYL